MNKSIVLICIVVTMFTACNTGKRSNNTQKNDVIAFEALDMAHNSRNSLDWAGVYKGVLPCADCEGTQTEIRLNENQTFEMVTTYLGKEVPPRVENGKFEWNEAGGKIRLISDASPQDTNRWFLVGENRLLLLDADGNRIVNNDPQINFFLEKIDMNNVITEKYWKLIDLNGKEITIPPNGPSRDAFFILKIADNRVTGNTGCNSMNGSYTLNEEGDNTIRFSPIATTRMACIGVDHEHEFLQVFEKTDNYVIQDDTLTLRQGETPLARFNAVYLR